MPAELNRILKTIKELDLKCEDMGAQIQDNFEELMKIPASKMESDEVSSLRKRLQEDQKLLIQWSEEKVQLATQGYDLLDAHYGQLENDITELTNVLQGNGQLTDDIYRDVYEDLDVMGRRSASRMNLAAYDLDPMSSIPAMPAVSNRKASISGQQSGYASEEYAPGAESMVWEATTTTKSQTKNRRGSEAPGGGLKRRAASAAVQKAAQAIADLEEEEPYRSPETLIPIPDPFVPGLKNFAEEPQAAGRVFTGKDISPNLVGRIAEVFWEDEGNPEGNLWYLVKIEEVDMQQREASILYQNGETERALNLDEMARKKHLRLIDF